MLFMKNKASTVDDVSAVDRSILLHCQATEASSMCGASAATLAAAPNKKLASHFSCLEEEKIECLSLNLLLLFRYSTLCVIGGG